MHKFADVIAKDQLVFERPLHADHPGGADPTTDENQDGKTHFGGLIDQSFISVSLAYIDPTDTPNSNPFFNTTADGFFDGSEQLQESLKAKGRYFSQW